MPAKKRVTDLTIDEKIGQMLVPSPAKRYGPIERNIQELKCGGVWPGSAFRHDAEAFREDIRRMQSLADIPLFINADFECGAGQLITDGSCVEFPALMAYGAITDIDEAVDLAYKTGEIVAQEAAYIGVNMSPTPVFDVNTIPTNPISNTRSVGSDPEKVWRIAGAYALGMQSGRLLPQAKHFPGEGMHRFDPHLALERMQVTAEEMDEIHLVPFRKAVEMDIAMMMTNHAIYPCFDEEYPCTLSEKIINGILRSKLGFDGMVMTDAMEMEGIVSRFGSEEAMILAINAGNDLILGPTGMENVHEWVKKALESGRIKIETIDKAVTRILRFKEKLRLYDLPNPLDKKPKMPLEQRQAVARKIAEKSITLIRDTQSLIPVRQREDARILLLEPSHPYHTLDWGLKYNLYSICDSLKEAFPLAEIRYFSPSPTPEETAEIVKLAKESECVFVSTSFKSRAGQVGLLNSGQIGLIKAVVDANEKTAFIASNPYVASELGFAKTIIANYGPYRVSVEATRDVILGKLRPQGVLPVELPDFIDPSKVETIAHD